MDIQGQTGTDRDRQGQTVTRRADRDRFSVPEKSRDKTGTNGDKKGQISRDSRDKPSRD